MVISTFVPIGKLLPDVWHIICHTQYFILEKYAYFCDILIKTKLYAQNVQPKFHLDVVIREGGHQEAHYQLVSLQVKQYECHVRGEPRAGSSPSRFLVIAKYYLCVKYRYMEKRVSISTQA